MADWNTAYNWMMDNEDSPRACKQVPDAGPAGAGPCYAISGINSGSWPTQFATIAAVPQEERGPAVEQFYRDNFWNHWFDQVASDDVCKRVFDFAVNANGPASVKCLQQAVNSLGGAQIKEDGCWGPATIAAVNAPDPNRLVSAFIAKRVAHYQGIAAANPERMQYLDAWTARAQK
jgi:type VI secretion system secreted protein VgrG